MPSDNPVLLGSFRGEIAETRHRGAYCVVRGSDVVDQTGAVEVPVLMRSAAKYFQALASVISGADRFGLDDRELALMCASHDGEPAHVATAKGMLAKAGLGEDALRCGAHLPLQAAAAARLRAHGEAPSALHNNCSGKHAGMLLAAKARGEPLETYLDAGHPRQCFILGVIATLAGIGEGEVRVAVDGCSAPTFALPLAAAARALAAFGQGARALGGAAATASERLRRAVAAEPVMLAGTERFCTAMVAGTRGRVLVKVGAEGYYAAIVPESGLGIALKIDDGATSAAERVIAGLLRRHAGLDAAAEERIRPFVDPVRRNHVRREIGRFELSLP